MKMNSIESIVRILEIPKQSLLRNITKASVRAQLPHLLNSQVVRLTFWGNLAQTINKYYKTNDYIIIEGYLSFKNEPKRTLKEPVQKKIEITVLKFYPLSLK